MTVTDDNDRALIIGASGGIGRAFADRLAADPACGAVITLSRSADGFDLTDEHSIRVAADRLGSEGHAFNQIICATGALVIDGHEPEKTIRAIDPQAMAKQFALNAIGPALAIKHFSPLLRRSGRSVFACLSARVGSIGDNRLGGWISYRASKAALNQIIRTSAIEIARSRLDAVVVGLHPGTVATSLSERYASGRDRLSPDESAARMLAVMDGLTPAETGGFFAYDGSPIVW